MENHLSYPDINCVLYQTKICCKLTRSKSQFLGLIQLCRSSNIVIFMFVGDRHISLKKVTLAEYRRVMSTLHGQEYHLRQKQHCLSPCFLSTDSLDWIKDIYWHWFVNRNLRFSLKNVTPVDNFLFFLNLPLLEQVHSKYFEQKRDFSNEKLKFWIISMSDVKFPWPRA